MRSSVHDGRESRNAHLFLWRAANLESQRSDLELWNPGDAILGLLLMINKVAVQRRPCRMVVFDRNFAHVKTDAATHGRARQMTGKPLQNNKPKTKKG